MFNSIISSDGLTLFSISICIVSSIVFGLVIGFIHMKEKNFSKNFVITLIVLPLLVATVMIMVNGNLGTGVAIAGAFSLVRFRSLQGTSREIITIFWAMAVGIAVGMGQIVFGGLITLIVGMVFILCSSLKFLEKNSKVLEILVPENLEYDTIFNEILEKYVDNYDLLKVKTTNLGSLYELKYNIVMKKNVSEKQLIDEIRTRNGNLKVCLHKDTEVML